MLKGRLGAITPNVDRAHDYLNKILERVSAHAVLDVHIRLRQSAPASIAGVKPMANSSSWDRATLAGGPRLAAGTMPAGGAQHTFIGTPDHA